MIRIYPAKEVKSCGECPSRTSPSAYGLRCNRMPYEDWSFGFGHLERIHPLCPLETKEQA